MTNDEQNYENKNHIEMNWNHRLIQFNLIQFFYIVPKQNLAQDTFNSETI